MEYNLKKKITIACTLDSSESIMFGQGGMHKISMKKENYDEGEHGCDLDFSCYDELEITFQMEKDHRSRFNFIVGEANKNKEQSQQE